MNNDLSTIRSALNTHLSTLVPGTLKQVAIGRGSVPTGYPFCRFFLSGIDNQLKDNYPSNWRTYRFSIQVMQETSAKDYATAEANFEDAIDVVLDKLSTQWTLSSSVDISEVNSGTIVVNETPQGITLAVTIDLSCRTLIA